MTASKCSVFSVLLATLAISPLVQAQQPAKNDPVATMRAYWDAVNSANLPATLELISDDLAPYTYATCTPQMSSKQCFGTFVQATIINRHGSLVPAGAPKVEGDVVTAIIEVRHDATRAAGIPRMLGTSTTTVKNNKITSFKFEQLPDDPHNKRLAAYNAAHPAPAVAPAR